MTHATDFKRYDCKLGKRRVSYAKLQGEYRCAGCGERIIERWEEASDDYPENWHVVCFKCLGHDFIHEREAAKQKYTARRALQSLPPGIVQAYLENRKGD